jgi:hypothetical protein
MSAASSEPAASAAGSRSVLRALEILELLAATERPLGLAQIAKELGIAKSSCLALLRALAARNFISQDDSGAYALGLRSFEVGAAYLRAVTPVGAVTPELRALTERLGMTSHFAVLAGDEVIYLAKQDPPGTGVRLASSLGARLSAWSPAVGKAQLAYADIIVAGGRGLGKAENFQLIWDLAAVLGAEVGGSRPVTHAGWISADRQVGQSGKTVRPKLYIAVGISGAIQHRVGMEASDVIIAINNDPNAPIFDFATYGLVGDALRILPALTEAFRSRLAVNRLAS